MDESEQFREKVRTVCDVYQEAPALTGEGVQVHSCDEMTEIPARQDARPPLPMTLHYVERKEFEYIRYGTSGLIASRNIVTAQAEATLIQSIGTESDFVVHCAAVVAMGLDDQH